MRPCTAKSPSGHASTIRGAVRVGDLVARWGGEEFAILAEATTPTSAREVAERVRALVAASRTRHDGRLVMARVSVGVAAADRLDTAERLALRADTALYAAKTSGRNRVVVAEPPG